MLKPSPELLAAIWSRAEEEEIGISIATSDPARLRHELNLTKQSMGEYEHLMTFCPEGRKEVFIVRKTVELPDAPT